MKSYCELRIRDFEHDAVPVELEAGNIPNINRISAACRKAGALNVFIQNSISEESKKSWSNWFDAFWTADKRAGMYDTFMVGRPGHSLHRDIQAETGDMHINKFRFGTFVEGLSDLHPRLQAKGIDTLIITGCATNICCESTARDAMRAGPSCL
jgi:ureidoacrylate peracid hydrolase